MTDLDLDDKKELAASEFLRFWNGDWTRPIVSHICTGCCADLAEAKLNLYSAAIGIDFMQSRDCDVPSLDDWGTCGAATGRTSLGILCHDVLQRTLAAALPDWNAMMPRAGPSDDEDVDRRRLHIQKKARDLRHGTWAAWASIWDFGPSIVYIT